MLIRKIEHDNTVHMAHLNPTGKDTRRTVRYFTIWFLFIPIYYYKGTTMLRQE